MTELLGLVPIGVDPNASTVDLMEAHPDEFVEPFFEYTVRRLRTERPETVVTVSWADLIEASADWPQPSNVKGLIFNVGRCGSTMLSNMIRSHSSVWMLSEPEPLAKPELYARRTKDLRSRSQAEAVYEACSVLLQCRAQDAGQSLVVKYPSWLAARAPAVASKHPEAAIIALYRDPLEVVASYIEKPPLFAAGMDAPAAVQMSQTPALAQTDGRPLTAASYYAAIWASTMVGAMAVEDQGLLILSYEQLRDDAAGCIEPLFAHLDLPTSPDVVASALQTTRHYAKPRSNDSVEYDPAGRHARMALSERTQAEVRQIVGTLEDDLFAQPAHLKLESR